MNHNNASIITIPRQKKWDQPYDQTITEAQIDQLLAIEPFRSIVNERIKKHQQQQNSPLTPHTTKPLINGLINLLRNETRICQFQENQIIYREADYGNCAYVVLSGRINSVSQLDKTLLGRSPPFKRDWLASLTLAWRNSMHAETRDISRYLFPTSSASTSQAPTQYLTPSQQAQGILLRCYQRGELFGELNTLRHSPRSSTLIADSDCSLLAIKWQGLRDLMQYSQYFKHHLETQYRSHGLRDYIQSLPLFRILPEDHLPPIIAAAVFESFGKHDWHHRFKTSHQKQRGERMKDETLIVSENAYIDGLLLLRSGFARMSKKYHQRQRCVDYLTPGDWFACQTLLDTLKHPNQRVYPFSLHAIGYADIIRIPTATFDTYIAPFWQKPKPRRLIDQRSPNLNKYADTNQQSLDNRSDLLEFFVDERYINGTQTMVINTERCTGCDDCVRACAMNHDNNPRFIRHGKKHGKLMIANACMHCVDPVCLIGCPTGAIHRSAEAGQVLINDDTCIGCTTCANSCPYDNIRMVTIQNQAGQMIGDEQSVPILKASKCDLCQGQRVAPACEQACPHDALRRINIHDIDTIADWLDT